MMMKKQHAIPMHEKKVNNTKDGITGNINITCYTDPLCCWSWAFEPQWRRFQYEFAGQLQLRYCMGGLLPDWKNYNDSHYSVSRPLQMGPVWMEAGHISGMPVCSKIWMENAPSSSYLACIAVKCVQLQSEALAGRYLRVLREAIMIEGKNIAILSVLLDITLQFSKQHPGILDIERFCADITGENGKAAFREDLREVKYYQINRFPTLIFKSEGKASIVLTGCQPYTVLLDAVKCLSPGIEPSHKATDSNAYTKFWGHITPRELQEIKEHSV
jgi:predicted DsbA family dithiol-disulfide isomerase